MVQDKRVRDDYEKPVKKRLGVLEVGIAECVPPSIQALDLLLKLALIDVV